MRPGRVREHRRRAERSPRYPVRPGEQHADGRARCRPATASDRRRRPARGRGRRREIAPSSSKASVASPCSCRDMPADMQVLAAVLDPLHRGRAASWRPAATHMSSRSGMTFCPKPPPVSRMITRTLVLRHAEQPGQRTARTSCGACVAAQMVSSPLAATTRRPCRGSPSAPARTPAGRSVSDT